MEGLGEIVNIFLSLELPPRLSHVLDGSVAGAI